MNSPASAPAAQMRANPPEGSDSLVSSSAANSGDLRRLEELWQKRTSDKFGTDFTLGPGDVIQISAPLEQLERREVRVSSRDNIMLPLAGVINVNGMTEQDLADTLRQRLSRYMYDPPVSLFVSHYGSREIAVMGAVSKPGLYTIESRSDTLMDMIGKAGGMTNDAATEVLFVPGGENVTAMAPSGSTGLGLGPQPFAPTTDPRSHMVGAKHEVDGHRAALQTESPVPIQPVASAEHGELESSSSPESVARIHPIVIWVTNPKMRDYLDLPARPRDLLIVPAAGEVTVGGWVQNPGAFKITPGMTALSSISAAGGALFSSSAQILRTAPDGQRLSIPLNISDVKTGRQSDISVQSGDVVVVDRSTMGAVPYAMYEVFSRFGTGMYIPIP
jgi:protein involved in polysaccharide export with SLBB domain